jgi:hypothetical protein
MTWWLRMSFRYRMRRDLRLWRVLIAGGGIVVCERGPSGSIEAFSIDFGRPDA